MSDPAQAASTEAAAEAERLAELNRRIAAAEAKHSEPASRVSQAHAKYALLLLAWRMVVELFAGMAIGLGMGWGLDTLLGTKPVFIVVFAALGFVAGVKTLMSTAHEADRMASDRSTDRPDQS